MKKKHKAAAVHSSHFDLGRLLKQIGAIAGLTFRELLREKVLWSAFVFAIFCVGLAYAVSQLSFAENARIALDFGLTAVSIAGGLISVIMGASLIAKEVQTRTLYLVLTKSIWRWQFVVGRFVGLVGVLILNTGLMLGALLVVYKAVGGALEASMAQSLLLQITEFGVLAAIACVFSAFSTSVFAAICASGIWVIGHAMGDFRMLAEKTESPVWRVFLSGLSKILPDLTRFDIKVEVAHHLPVTWSYTAVSMAYGIAYACFALVAACLVFSRRDL